MGKQLVLYVILLSLFVVFVSSCTPASCESKDSVLPTQEKSPIQEESSDTPMAKDGGVKWALPPMIMVEEKLYMDLYIPNPLITVDDDQVLGYISSVVNITNVPEQNGEANYDVLGAPYARWRDDNCPDAVIIYYDEVWHVLVPNGYQ